MSKLLHDLNWRYATKKMNGQTVPEDKVQTILEAARLAPTSSGLQPFEILVIVNPEIKQQILPLAYNQKQIIDSSHLLVFAAWNGDFPKRIEKVFEHNNKERGLPESATEDYKNMLLRTFAGRPDDANFNFAARQAYIAFGIAIAAAAEQKVDATPMEGFDGPAIDKLLNLEEQNLKAVTLLPLGYRDESGDWLVNLKKVRRPTEQMIHVLA